MTTQNLRRVLTSATRVVVLVLGAAMASCSPAGPVPNSDFSFRASKVTATSQTEFYETQGCAYLISNCYDEPYLVQVWFRVRYGVADSAQTGVVSSRSASPEPTVCATLSQPPCPAGSEAEVLAAGAGKSGAQVTFPGVARMSLADYLAGAPLEIVGTWTWAMEEDWVGTPLPTVIAPVLEKMLNDYVASAAPPEDPSETSQDFIDRLTEAVEDNEELIDAVNDFLGTVGDDSLGSRIYAFVASSGGLATTLDLAAYDYTQLNLEMESLGIPDVTAVSIRSTDAKTFASEAYQGAGGRHLYDMVAG
jgi:hypothetical protein